MSNIEKIRQEIMRMHQEAVLAACGNHTDWLKSRIATCVDILAFIDSLPEEKQPEDLEGKQMIKELKERIVGLDNNGNPIAAAPPDIPMIVEKVNVIIRYLTATHRK